jgi:pentatricopeptide repeat protein
VPVWSASFCEPASPLRAEIQKIELFPAAGATDFDRNIAAALALRDRYANDLFAHEQYQNAVHRHGIEGHLRSLTEEYQTLASQHSSELTYRYLYVRTLIGRSTPSAIQALEEIVAENPGFAPAHRALAEIFASETFRDPGKEKAEKERFLALCPGTALARHPAPLPDPSPLVGQAERLLADGGDPDRAVEMAFAGIRADEWRLQRIRPFDWYSVQFKRQQQRQLRTEYWRAWSVEVRCYRKTGRYEKAAELLAQMEARSQNSTDREVLAILMGLYADSDRTKFEQLRKRIGDFQPQMNGKEHQ